MSKKRLYELAKELKTTNQEMLWVVKKMGVDAKNHMSTVTEDQEKEIRDFILLAFKRLEEKEEERKQALKEKKERERKEIEKHKKLEKEEKKPEAPPKKAAPRPSRAKDTSKVSEKKIEKDELEPLPVKEEPRRIKNKPEKKYKKKDKQEEPEINRKKSLKERRQRKKYVKKKASGPKQAPAIISEVSIGEEITVKDLAMKITKTASDVIATLMKMGVMTTINEVLDYDTAVLLLDEYDIKAKFKTNKRQTEIKLPTTEDDKPKSKRPPIITVMGHVDHGKTSLLDAIRSTKVTADEAGGITQHIGAYQVEKNGEKMTFIDTPGHAAFTSMRARGAQITDIAILVVAADDGVMPQTLEAIAHSKAAGVPIIVAVNKIDKEGANPERVMQQLTEQELVPEEWGGETIFCKVSALNGEGIDALLEMILLVAEVEELKANADRLAEGFVIEAELDKGRGPVATLLVKEGTLRIGDTLVTGQCVGRVRAMNDEQGRSIEEADPATPVEVLGLNTVPHAGDIFQSIDDEKLARDVVEQRCIVEKEETVLKSRKVTLEDLFQGLEEGEKKELNLIIKGDVQGSVEAVNQSLLNLNTDEVRVSIIHSGVGAVTETDVILASASSAIIIGFNVRPDSNAKRVAAEEEVEIKLYRIIYEAIDDVRAAMAGLLDPVIKEVELGVAEVRDVFKVPKAGAIAGSYVTSGKITSTSKVRLVRDGVVIFDGSLNSLRRFKDDVKEVTSGYECGIGLEKFNDLKEGDIIEAYTHEKIAREL